jgi:GGDEF domain-containing protein
MLLRCFSKSTCVSRERVRLADPAPGGNAVLLFSSLSRAAAHGTIIALADLILFIGFHGSTGAGHLTEWQSKQLLSGDSLVWRGAAVSGDSALPAPLCQFNQRFGHPRATPPYEIARWLDHMEPEGRAFRFGNVEFALLLPWESQEKGRSSLETVQRRFQRTWTLGDAETLIPARLTDLVCRGQAWTEAQVLELLEHGLRLAKQGPEETVECGEAVWEALERRKELLELIRRSIRERRFRVWYQPVYRCGTGAFSSAEALLRLEDFQGRGGSSVFIRWP